ncbi:MAG: helix-turn-helix domain-containing protein [Betaproteobacteria bacterium]|nr:helix-turn-helix domain-containing protein [Betaproteobacteria bacterium]
MNAPARTPLYVPNEQEIEVARESSRLLAACIGKGKTARVRVIDGGKDITVPVSALHMLVDILNNMAQGNAVTMVPVNAELTTQQAADFLNVSRPYLVKLLEEGRLPFRKVGTRRRVMFKDLLAYQEILNEKSRKAADELTKQSQELGLGY